ncbi:PepSY domain-containing protein [Rhodopseudomonas sp. HC1]|uniref:PepSY-associated TM helix domain-containing protein n=1 Tax=Rhodopseudomonas infernalis TaxID=2897386 RepID=UPI001EE87537|nr:PepSY-associated TM helix domain-containing protein [Rhodopseudomonas infernalis]MCG6205149.1 PepSY domain-containing protein [Rhodopseudomonas infernalis]
MLITFRQSMTWLHTWCGLVFGWLLFAIFVSGTLAVFRYEIDYWMMPELHVPMESGDLVAVGQRTLQSLAPGAARWLIELPADRAPVLRLRWQQGPKDRLKSIYVDASGQQLSPRETRGGSMIYRFHYGLLLGRAGIWIVGALAMAMLIGLVSGVIIHADIFRDFFTFRPLRPAPRAWLDAHTVCGIAVLPFCLVITYSGLVIWWFIWMPGGIDLAFGGDQAGFFRAASPRAVAQPITSSEPAAPTDMSRTLARLQDTAPDRPIVTDISVRAPGTAAAKVEVSRMSQRVLWGESDRLSFDGVSGEIIERTPERGRPAFVTHRVFRIIHEIKFADLGLRWIYFVMACVSSAVIATGTTLWGTKRRIKHFKAFAAAGASGRGVLVAFGVDAVNAGVIAGMATALGAYFVANRLLPPLMPGRADTEVTIFFVAWLGCIVVAVCLLAASRSRMTSVDGVQTALRRLWAILWGVAVGVAAAVAPLDEAMTRGISRAIRDGDAIVLSFHGVIIAVGAVMAWLFWMNLRRIPQRRGAGAR